MNERLKELWDKSKTSGVHPKFGEYDMYSAEKFAELIIQECADVCERFGESGDGYTCSAEILEHFGVE